MASRQPTIATTTPPGLEPATPDAAETETVSRLRLAVTRLHRRLRQESAGDLTPSQASALASIDRLGSPTLGELAVREAVQPPSLTRIIAGLEERGLVIRLADDADRRVTRVVVTPAGRSMLDERRSLRDAYLLQRLQLLPARDRAALGSLTALLERLVEGEEP